MNLSISRFDPARSSGASDLAFNAKLQANSTSLKNNTNVYKEVSPAVRAVLDEMSDFMGMRKEGRLFNYYIMTADKLPKVPPSSINVDFPGIDEGVSPLYVVPADLGPRSTLASPQFTAMRVCVSKDGIERIARRHGITNTEAEEIISFVGCMIANLRLTPVDESKPVDSMRQNVANCILAMFVGLSKVNLRTSLNYAIQSAIEGMVDREYNNMKPYEKVNTNVILKSLQKTFDEYEIKLTPTDFLTQVSGRARDKNKNRVQSYLTALENTLAKSGDAALLKNGKSAKDFYQEVYDSFKVTYLKTLNQKFKEFSDKQRQRL
ncbi:MAG: hypothetical protein V4691_07880 [Pseudomonadota bacterium]